MKKQTATTNSDTRMLELRQELWDTARELRYAYARFNFITDPGLIDAGIYDINALKSRYDFLLRKMKALQGRPLVCETEVKDYEDYLVDWEDL